MTTKPSAYHIITILVFILSSCNLNNSSTEQKLPAQTETPTIIVPTAIVVDAGPSATQPSPAGDSHGVIIYDDSENIISIDPETGETKVLISRRELHLILTEDKSADSYTYGYERPVEIALSPDFTKALVSICASLDERFRCIFEDYIYYLQDKTAVKLPTPPNTYGVYWKWSPDGSKLAGAAWGYDRANYLITRFYSVEINNENLISLGPVTNDNWQITWNPSSKAFHPLTFITNFQSIYTDGTKSEDIPIAELEWNDKVECLSFSPDGSEAVFVIRREQPKDYDWVYRSRSNFTDITKVTEYSINSRYLCSVDWSPDQRFVHIRYAHDTRAETGEKQGNEEPRQDKLIKMRTNSLIDSPKNLLVCGWTPNSNLVYERKSIAGEEGNIEIVDPETSETVDLSENVQTLIRHCPVYWLAEKPAFDIPTGLSVKNACHPGASFQDEADEVPAPELFDFVKASTSLENETLNLALSFTAASADLTNYLTPEVTNFLNGWDVLVDVDNNLLSGDKYGIEFVLSIGISPGSGAGSPTLEGFLLQFDPITKKFTRISPLQMSFNAPTKTLILNSDVPGITEDSRLVFLSRMVDTAKNAVVGDRLCE